MHKKILIPSVIFALLLLGAGGVLAYKHLAEKEAPLEDHHAHDEVHYHAGFQVYLDDELLDFSTFQYMELKPCGPGDITEEDTVHLHGNIGDVVHVHKAGMTWRNLAEYLSERSGETITEDMAAEMGVKAYLNGELTEDFLSKEIKPYDSLVVFVGRTTDEAGKLAGAVTKEHVEYAESLKENCGL